jgi:hypothetical protein
MNERISPSTHLGLKRKEHLLPEVLSHKLQQLFVLEATIESILKRKRERIAARERSMAQLGSWIYGCSKTQGRE